ncbi:MAG TPA: pyruvate, phosphate dikinase [Egibacteraceae bacterium]|nr:pyruvate, phosphate dikinase [Egibacteraceae bacterium]
MTLDSARNVYSFSEGDRHQKALLGGKGANLAEMTRLGLPVPPGFTITTAACRAYLAEGELPDRLIGEIEAALHDLETAVSRKFGDPADPLLVSVRSGAPFSMPGMMDTVLNLGLNDRSVRTLSQQTGDERFAWDAYRRLIQLFGKVVLGVPGAVFEEALAKLVAETGAADESGLAASDLRELTDTFKAAVGAASGTPFPQDPHEQLRSAVEAVFRSWNGRRARDYRRMEGIADDLGTAVNVQAMVFGNLGGDSGTGVAFTRDPATGERVPYGDWLEGAQGEDVVAGTRITRPLAELSERFPECDSQLLDVLDTLEQHYGDMCDIEFTIERGRLFILQTRVGKRSAAAALRIAVEMTDEGLITQTEAVKRVLPAQLEQLLHPQFAPHARYRVLTRGLAASPGAATGAVVFTADQAEARARTGEAVLLVRPETSPDDLHGMIAAKGILTSRGGLVSHAAVVARGMGRPAVCGADEIEIDLEKRLFRVGDFTVVEGDVVSIDGGTGEVVVGPVSVVIPKPDGTFDRLLGWADGLRRLRVRANADTPDDAARARAFGADGIGLCRTEHMFLGERLGLIQEFILADGPDEERHALDRLEALQRADFAGLFRSMHERPVTIRLLDPPLHEFLPDIEELAVADARGELDEASQRLLTAARHWHEANPMLGTRGCRLGILRPELYRMQVRAIVGAAADVAAEGLSPRTEIMVPLVAATGEMTMLSALIRDAAEEAQAAGDQRIAFKVGTMIETPRATLIAGELAETAEFFSFGTNDLTQMAFGFSRDDVEGRIMPRYLEAGVLPADPFRRLDRDGVGRLISLAVREGRAVRGSLETGVCGEHGGDPDSIRVCHELGVDYVSCSPYRVPVARLAAAHAAIGAESTGASV